MAFPWAVHPAAGEERQRTQRTEQGRDSRRRITRLLPMSPAAGLGRSACETRDSLVPTRTLGQPDSLLCNQGAGALLGAAANVPAHGNVLFLKWRWKDACCGLLPSTCFFSSLSATSERRGSGAGAPLQLLVSR